MKIDVGLPTMFAHVQLVNPRTTNTLEHNAYVDETRWWLIEDYSDIALWNLYDTGGVAIRCIVHNFTVETLRHIHQVWPHIAEEFLDAFDDFTEWLPGGKYAPDHAVIPYMFEHAVAKDARKKLASISEDADWAWSNWVGDDEYEVYLFAGKIGDYLKTHACLADEIAARYRQKEYGA